jgi:hypothetical protein
MKHLFAAAVLVNVLSFAFIPGAAHPTRHRPAAPKTYQVKGPVLELTSDMIVVKKGNDRWEIARDASTKVTGDLKVGATVTIQYRMTAAAIEVKASKKP